MQQQRAVYVVSYVALHNNGIWTLVQRTMYTAVQYLTLQGVHAPVHTCAMLEMRTLHNTYSIQQSVHCWASHLYWSGWARLGLQALASLMSQQAP